MRNKYGQVMRASVGALVVLLAGRVTAGNLDPTNAPAPTMHTLEEIYQKVQNLAPQTLQTLSDTTEVVSAGYYAATNLAQVDADLAAGNIKTNVTLFGIAGTLSTGSVYSSAVPKSGQTNSFQTGDDGYYQKGMPWPNPRFTIQSDTNCVLDNMTGLVWARNANMNGLMTWSNAIVYCETLNYGGQTDWRMPNLSELRSLIDVGNFNPALPSGHPFADVQSDSHYWSSTAYVDNPELAWLVYLVTGLTEYTDKMVFGYHAWPVRGGQ